MGRVEPRGLLAPGIRGEPGRTGKASRPYCADGTAPSVFIMFCRTSCSEALSLRLAYEPGKSANVPRPFATIQRVCDFAGSFNLNKNNPAGRVDAPGGGFPEYLRPGDTDARILWYNSRLGTGDTRLQPRLP